MPGVALQLRDLVFRYTAERFALRLAHLEVIAREHLAITGPSGCGKTTLLRLSSGILIPETGSVQAGETVISSLPDPARRQFRLRHIGLVFQTFELVPYLNARDNILLPYRVSRDLRLAPEVKARAEALAEQTGITHLLDQRPAEISQGERQRIALCRALITQPSLILADEPTGSLDPQNQQRAVALLHDQARQAGAALIMVTHEPSLLSGFDRHISLPELQANA
ncbi:MAG: putative ABC transport system ATP-binding protein/lipoprotein-releasing system ATP-binding protein [Verrucomicrobia bacterium]|jgi:ABC-type lipoprotein export system ATPase subunit|nr:MAG: putative ABC transport system ATP-binding protein/lipoprotein-releasing system ATP-binding protein [Verrucomicrobiota bacterium]